MNHLQYQQYQREPQQQSTERNGHSHHGVMDIRNLCQRLDVDSLKAKLSTLPQLKLPKSLPKLRAARRFFHSSRENGSGKAAPGTGTGAGTGTDSLAAAMPQAQFINRTPQRISTISSLMHEQAAVDRQVTAATSQHLQPNAGTYRSAGSLDDEYYAPYGTAGRGSRPISPIRMPPDTTTTTPTTTTTTSSLTQRLQRGYKSLSELRLKHLFAKQTTIRRDGIEVDRYVEQYEAERRLEQLEQARRDREIADNYDIHISTLPMSRQNTLKEEEEQQQQQQDQHKRSVPEHSGDESGMEEAMPQQQPPPRKKSGIAASRFAKVRQPPLPMPVQEQQEQAEQPRHKEQQPMRQAVRQNLKRLRKSIKRVHHQPARPAADETDEDEEQTKTRTSTGGTLRARLRRFASSEQLPQRWRKSFKSNSETQEQPAQQLPGGASAGTAGVSAGAALGVAMGAHLERTMTMLNEKMQQLKFFQRAGDKKAAEQMGNKPNTIGREPVEIDDEELEATYHHSDSASDDSDQEVVAAKADNQPDAAKMEHEQEQQQKDRVAASPGLVKRQTLTTLAQLQAHSTTAWSSESLEEDASAEQQLATAASDYPRVLIHQQQTDAFESTLIIAVTATPPPSSPAAPIAAGKQRSTAHQWVSNEQIIADFKAQQVTSSVWPAPALYKPKSIDIFEGDVGAAAAFADFDEALRNAPVLRISTGSSCDSGEDADDSSSRVTKIRLQTPQIGNSCESLMEQQPLEDEEEDDDAAEEDDYEDEDDDDDDDEQALAERPPSVSPPPPPLPQRRPPPSTVAPIYDAVPPPLPISKPPIATAIMTAAPAATAPLAPAAAAMPLGLAKLPQRSVSMTRPSKPLVKTSSLRLTYREQMHPGDVGKVNKLISRFEGRPRLCPRRLHSEELTICSDADDEPDQEPDKNTEKEKEEEQQQLPPTPTPANVKRNAIPDIVTTQAISNNNNNNNNNNNKSGHDSSRDEAQLQLSLDRQNSNCSRSEYGSPLAYPLSNSRRRSSTPTMATALNTSSSLHAFTPQSQSQSQLLQQQQRAQARRSRRSLTRDDDNFYSFDSDEENSYYSISPSSSSRYVVEI
ncbi:actin cytoskeleton-regulatory complex protein PAN1 [Drosophila novamexicana]|uniref:actin cytoskeleton-regulatory complex protein PAN1 n=1 Tax=Drosophila novamexicana TaxID=47314 RepID=UPI0011E5A1B9|nr:actin cytoskeleton-regulatory complex protein PAN1 [Drosophila novamexicana]